MGNRQTIIFTPSKWQTRGGKETNSQCVLMFVSFNVMCLLMFISVVSVMFVNANISLCMCLLM